MGPEAPSPPLDLVVQPRARHRPGRARSAPCPLLLTARGERPTRPRLQRAAGPARQPSCRWSRGRRPGAPGGRTRAGWPPGEPLGARGGRGPGKRQSTPGHPSRPGRGSGHGHSQVPHRAGRRRGSLRGRRTGRSSTELAYARQETSIRAPAAQGVQGGRRRQARPGHLNHEWSTPSHPASATVASVAKPSLEEQLDGLVLDPGAHGGLEPGNVTGSSSSPPGRSPGLGRRGPRIEPLEGLPGEQLVELAAVAVDEVTAGALRDPRPGAGAGSYLRARRGQRPREVGSPSRRSSTWPWSSEAAGVEVPVDDEFVTRRDLDVEVPSRSTSIGLVRRGRTRHSVYPPIACLHVRAME
jgi:hypothetical protein